MMCSSIESAVGLFDVDRVNWRRTIQNERSCFQREVSMKFVFMFFDLRHRRKEKLRKSSFVNVRIKNDLQKISVELFFLCPISLGRREGFLLAKSFNKRQPRKFSLENGTFPLDQNKKQTNPASSINTEILLSSPNLISVALRKNKLLRFCLNGKKSFSSR